MKKTNCPCKPPVRPRVELSDRTDMVPIPDRKPPLGPLRPGFPTFCEDNQGSRRSPAKRVRWEKEEQRSKRFFTACGGNERYGACDDAKQGKRVASEPTLPTSHLPAVWAGRFELRATLSALRGSSASGAGASIARGCPPRTSQPPEADLRAEARTHCLFATSALLRIPTEKGKEIRKRKKTENGT